MSDPAETKSWLRWLLAPQQRLLNAALALAVAAAGLFILQSWLLASLFSHWLLAWQAGSLASFDSSFWWPWLVGLPLCFILRPWLQYGRERLSQRASLRVRQALREQLLQRLAMLGPARRGLGADAELGSRLLEQVDALDGYVSRYQVQRQLVVIVPLLLLLATAWHSLLAAALLLATAPLVPLFMVLLGQAAANASQRQFVALGQMSGRFLDLLRGMATLRHLQALDRAQLAVEQAAEDYRSRTMRVLRMAFLSGAVLELFASIAIAMVALYLGMGLLGMLPWAQGEIPVPYQGALFILLLAPEFYAPLRQLGSDYHARAEAEGALAELLPLLKLELWQHPGTEPLQLQQAPVIDCRSVGIDLPGAAARLCPLDLRLAAGERVWLRGPSGSGKSTLLHVLLGFLPHTGEVLIDDLPLDVVRRSDWHRHVGFLAQQPELIPGTLADNLRLAAPGASNQQLIAALQEVDLWPLLRQLPLQLATPLGERGLGLSGGQLSRLALARLLLRDTWVWLLDEPLAHLDPQTAELIGRLLERLSRGRTVLLVSHETVGLDWLDRQVELQEGEHG
ncbi:thiol reductant ABC exporter subunit CydD [Halopseudomonas bauzanensis]|uniref:ATP-binding cassette, subfamily C, CydD n=1 Tax=Halopseudomonas bauzanensis TaxID=653930 RepID=A0A1I4KMG7_9GAMM|nr:thiol reductant ABC exporter subunit CydD [Halopseudomonas bauzanensis]SER37079.1 ATP-binding cassette, subfamily C, CydD [Halopseudomonas bauzanensis]SFL79965.1 ATP-binding cassette, subfamily C, CydD [Halopseudomonas bauzanensis]